MSDNMSGESAGGCTSARQSCSDRQYVFGVVTALPILSFPYGTKIKLRMRNNGFVQVTAKEIDGSIGRYYVYELASCPGYWFVDAQQPIARNVKVQP